MNRGTESVRVFAEAAAHRRQGMHQHVPFAILCATGLRVGEVLSLKVSDLDKILVQRRAR